MLVYFSFIGPGEEENIAPCRDCNAFIDSFACFFLKYFFGLGEDENVAPVTRAMRGRVIKCKRKKNMKIEKIAPAAPECGEGYSSKHIEEK
jgi:hypothetical protein